MKKAPHSIPYLLLGGAIALAATPIAALFTAFYPVPPGERLGLLLLTLSLAVFGIGQVLNHPAHSGNIFTHDTASRFYRLHQRYQSPCALGNLLFIFSILLFCIGLAKIISF